MWIRRRDGFCVRCWFAQVGLAGRRGCVGSKREQKITEWVAVS